MSMTKWEGRYRLVLAGLFSVLLSPPTVSLGALIGELLEEVIESQLSLMRPSCYYDGS